MLENFTNNYKETSSNTKLNIKVLNRKTEIVFYRKTYSNNLLYVLFTTSKKINKDVILQYIDIMANKK